MTDKTNAERKVDAMPLVKRASEKEAQWRLARGLTKGLHQKSNAKAMDRRRRVSNPKEPKGTTNFRKYRDGKLGKMGAASKVRRIDPVTGDETITLHL